jgi:CRISPR/Cas system endoribonuclease Cas6 (RAMP superfamily)
MRLLIKLEAMKDQAYDAMYHHKVRGMRYDLKDLAIIKKNPQKKPKRKQEKVSASRVDTVIWRFR